MIVFVYTPLTAPFVVFVDNAIVGVEVVDHTIPLTVIVAPPFELMVPPLVALDPVMDVATAVAETVGSTAIVVKLVSVP